MTDTPKLCACCLPPAIIKLMDDRQKAALAASKDSLKSLMGDRARS